MRTDYTSQDILTYSDFNSIYEEIKTLYEEIVGSTEVVTKYNGQWLFSEDMNKIETMVTKMSKALNIEYTGKTTTNMTYYDYRDFNRLGIQLINIQNKLNKLKSGNIVSEEGAQIITEDNNNIILEG